MWWVWKHICRSIFLKVGVMNGTWKFLTARQNLPLLDLLAKFKRVLACSCSPSFCVARKLAKQIFYFCSCSQKNSSAQHVCECSQRPFVTPKSVSISGAEIKLTLRAVTAYVLCCIWFQACWHWRCAHFQTLSWNDRIIIVDWDMLYKPCGSADK